MKTLQDNNGIDYWWFQMPNCADFNQLETLVKNTATCTMPTHSALEIYALLGRIPITNPNLNLEWSNSWPKNLPRFPRLSITVTNLQTWTDASGNLQKLPELQGLPSELWIQGLTWLLPLFFCSRKNGLRFSELWLVQCCEEIALIDKKWEREERNKDHGAS